MREKEIYLFSLIEEEHFFYRARRELVKYWLKKLLPPYEPKPLVIDVGTGTGILLEELGDDYELVGCDRFFHPEISYSPLKLIKADARCLPFSDGIAQAVIALDLLEHLEKDKEGLAELSRILCPGGYLFLNLPAFSFLWSDWDQAVGHRRRYRKSHLVSMIRELDLEIVFLNYVNSLGFFPILFYRKLRTWLRRRKHRLEDRLLPKWLNQIFFRAFVFQGKYSWLKIPFGVSIFAVLRKPGN